MKADPDCYTEHLSPEFIHQYILDAFVAQTANRVFTKKLKIC